jgi:hypothetical protein
MRVAIIAASLALSACATHQASAGLDGSFRAMIGQPVEVALARLGQPIAAVPMGTDTVYGWGYVFSGTEVLIPTAGAGIEAADFRGGVFPPPRRTVQNSCVIRMVAGADGLIRDWDYQGDDRGCRAFAASPAGEALARLDR